MHADQYLGEAIIKSAQHIVLVLDTDGRIVRINPYLENLSGWLLSEVRGRDWFKTFLPEKDQQRIRALFARALTERRTRGNVNVIVTKDGRELEIEWDDVPLTASDGEVFGLVSTGEDVTERRRLERKLKESHAQLQADSVALSRLNEATTRLWRLPDLREGLTEILNATIEMMRADFGNVQLFDPTRNVLVIEAQRGFDQAFLDYFREVSTTDDTACGRAMRSGEPALIEDVEIDPAYAPYRAIAKEAGYRAVQSTPLIDADGGFLGMISTHWRVPHRLGESELRYLDLYAAQAAGYIASCRVKQALREREGQLRAVMNTAVDAIVTIDEHGIIRKANPSTEHIFGYSLEELIGENVKILMPPPYRDKHDRYINGYMLARVPRAIGRTREVVARRKDGTLFPIDISVSEIECPRLFTAIVRDISDRKHLEEHLLKITENEQLRIGQELHDGAQQSLVAVEFVAKSIAKEIKALDDLSESHLTLEEFDFFTRVERLHNLIDNLQIGLTQASREVYDIARNLSPVNLDMAGLKIVLKRLADRVSETCDIQCTLQTSGKLVLADTSKGLHLFRIAQEAVNNAVKHSQCREIEIRLSGGNRQLHLEVCDNGMGFDPHEAARRGMGMRTMTYRANLIGANLDITQLNEGGTCIYCSLETPQK